MSYRFIKKIKEYLTILILSIMALKLGPPDHTRKFLAIGKAYFTSGKYYWIHFLFFQVSWNSLSPEFPMFCVGL